MESLPQIELADEAAPALSVPRFTRRQRIALPLIGWIGALAIRVIGCTLRVSIARETGAEAEPRADACIYCFWHRCILPATYIFRNLNIGVMTSRSFDGEFIARIIQKFGFIPVRGSSSRGAVGGLRGMQRLLEAGNKVAFAIDGPRGPRYLAKPGPIMLARATGIDVVAFYIAPERGWVLKSWDRLVIPKPFSRVQVFISSPLHIAAGADQEDSLSIMQSRLDRVHKRAEEVFPSTAV